jgi:NAD(P)-dependent dehydrogenase (short-subunit alcohol dehydrogenase family)
MAVILITGGAKRIGKAIAQSVFHNNKVIIHYHNSDNEAKNLADWIINQGGEAVTVQQDLLQNNASETLFKNALNYYGTIDTIIHVASLFLHDTLYDFSAELWQKHQTIHVTVPMILTHLLTKHFIDTNKKTFGNIIHLIDQRIKSPTPEFFSYTASKMFLGALTRQSAIACSPHHIRVNAICPGSTLPSPRQTDDDFLQQARLNPLGMAVNVSDITNAVQFILNSQAITGEIITLDSGQNFDWRTINFLESKE